MAGKLTFTPEDFQQAAVQYRPELLLLPIIGCAATLDFMTGRPGIRYSERVGKLAGSAQFGPYDPKRKADFNLEVNFRDLNTFFGSVVAEFEPNTAVSTILGKGATKGDGQMSTPTAVDVLRLIAAGLSENLNAAIWSAKRNESGTTTADLFNGFDTITEQEISAGNIADAKGNYLKLDTKIDKSNAYDIARQILRSLDPRLRQQETFLYCSQEFLDDYNEAYMLTHGCMPYNKQFDQQSVEGSNGLLKFVPLFNKADSKFIHVAPKSNMLYGYDSMGDVESVMVKEYAPFVLSYIATMFFGVQFESIDKSRLKVIELASE